MTTLCFLFPVIEPGQVSQSVIFICIPGVETVTSLYKFFGG